MSDVILAVLGSLEEARAVLDAAARLRALRPGSRLHVLAIMERVSLHALEAELLISKADAVLSSDHDLQERLTTLGTASDRSTESAGEAAAGALWLHVEGTAATALGERGSRADVIVAEQPIEQDRASRQLFRAALFGSGRPVLMVPRKPTAAPFGRKVAIAWRDEKQAARAVIPALRYLVAAPEMHVLVGLRDITNTPAMPRIFAEHGIDAELHPLPLKPDPFGRTLLAKAHELGADMLVMGAYAHSPLRELILGGVTKYMVDNADLPVLMRH